MISEKSIKQIAAIFCGDTGDYYSYKSGPALVSFFNSNFNSNDIYSSGFPSRWIYVNNKIVNMINSGSINSFFDLILSKYYFMQDSGLTEVESAEKAKEAYNEFNRIVSQDLCAITSNNGHFNLIKQSEDLVHIGSGGFADVYLQKSTGMVLKKLKDSFLDDESIRSRFKREFNITKSLKGLFGVIDVYEYDDGNCSYTMEKAEITLEDYILKNTLSLENKNTCIRQILFIISEVHKKNIIHRDISPNNIFIISGQLKIADFGLGKDLNVFSSHQTLYTNAVGQYWYCAPEQFMMLREADKRSDVYSLGRVMNFIMTTDPCNSNHEYKNVCEKATNTDAAYRYGDASQLSAFFEKAIEYNAQAKNEELIESKIKNRLCDFEIESYLYHLAPEEISKNIKNNKEGFMDVTLLFMERSETHGQFIIQSIDKSFRDVCDRSFAAYDPFATFAERVLRNNFSFTIKEIAASILRFVAWDVNRFYAQRIVEDLLNLKIDPMLKEIIKT